MALAPYCVSGLPPYVAMRKSACMHHLCMNWFALLTDDECNTASAFHFMITDIN